MIVTVLAKFDRYVYFDFNVRFTVHHVSVSHITVKVGIQKYSFNRSKFISYFHPQVLHRIKVIL